MACIVCGNECIKKYGRKDVCSQSCWMKLKWSSGSMVSGNKGNKYSDEIKKKLSEAKLKNPTRYWKGKSLSEKHKRRLSESIKKKWSNGDYADRDNFGYVPWNKKHYNTSEIEIYLNKIRKIWRLSVFERDDYICQFCKARSVKGKKVVLNADHIYPVCKIIDNERWDLVDDIDNGRTLCIDCHKQTSTWGVNKHTYV